MSDSREPHPPTCSICNQPVHLETSKTDENGKPVHEECYLRKLGLKPVAPPFNN